MTATTARPRAVSTTAAVEEDPFLGSAVALAGLTLVAAIGMGRLFANASFFLPVVLTALVAHAASWWARRNGMGLFAGLALTAGASIVMAVWTILPHTTVYGIPWTETWRTLSDELSRSWHEFSRVVAPAPVTKGFLLAATGGVAVTAALADWAAYRVRATFEPLLPPFTLFLFASALGHPRHRAVATAAFVGAALLFLVVHQAALKADTTAWFASRARGGVGALLQGGAVLGLVAVVAAVFLGPQLPGAEAKGLVSWRKSGEGGNRDRVTTSPLVDIRGRLVRQSEAEVFTVRSAGRSYWHLTTLDTFNGSIWSSNTTYRSVKRDIPGGISPKVERRRVVQQFRISALEAIWLPAAYRADRIEGVDGVSYNSELGSLISKNATTDGLTYTVESEIPEFDPAALNAADPSIVPDERFVELPRLPGDVTREARRIVQAAGATTTYEMAKALQDHFRNNFTYDLRVRSGHDDRALVNFLFRDKRGYCEQFAGAYAAMARSLGMYTRVAVGFTPGELESDGLFHVRGLNAHAWPEVWLGEYGWVAFEPTPGRGRPGAEQYTGVREMQASPVNQGSTSTTVQPTTTTSSSIPPEGTTPTTEFRDVEAGGGEDGESAGKVNPVLRAVGVVLALAVAWSVVVPLLLRRRRVRRRAGAATPVDRVLVAWAEAGEALLRAGSPRRPSETVHEYARRGPSAAGLGDKAGEAMRSLAQQAAMASYSPGDLPAETVARAITAARTVETSVGEKAGWKRVLWHLDPRPLLPAPTRRVTGAAGSATATSTSTA